jgi:palmitoyltransferase
MDHHCVWIGQCVGARNQPDFIRFLFFAIATMGLAEKWVWGAGRQLWKTRNASVLYGPSAVQLTLLLVITILNSLVLFTLTILFLRVLYAAGVNETSIETWERERHETLVDRSKKGLVYDNDGNKIRISHQEFPFDVGIWTNLCGAFASSNPLLWFVPFVPTPNDDYGLENEHNLIEDLSLPWPPPDPEKDQRKRKLVQIPPRLAGHASYTEAEVAAFRDRQAQDLRRRGPRKANEDDPFVDQPGAVPRAQASDEDDSDDDSEDEDELQPWEKSWVNGEGDSLADFGVDEDADGSVYVARTSTADGQLDDDVPLAQLIRDRKAQ